jgi:tetratricopeptide (TPR) repeat protein
MFRLYSILLFLLAFGVIPPGVNQLLKEAQEQESLFHENEAFHKYAEILKLEPDNIVALCKCSELCSRIGARQNDREKMKPYFIAAKNYAVIALRVNPVYSDANFAMSLALGRLSLVGSIKERVELAKDVRIYAENAVRLDPNNFKAYHILGRWNYEVSNLNMAEKAFAKIFYGGLPNASMQQAIYDFNKSRTINPNFVLNYLELARSYHHEKDDKSAKLYLRQLLTMPNMIYDDARAKTQARQMLTEWQ